MVSWQAKIIYALVAIVFHLFRQLILDEFALIHYITVVNRHHIPAVNDNVGFLFRSDDSQLLVLPHVAVQIRGVKNFHVASFKIK
jgi:hypothetical protein